MQTNYERLNYFEAATVGMIVVGFLLIGFYTFMSLDHPQQRQVSVAFDVLDVSAEVPQVLENIRMITDGQQEFYNQFYLAFVEIVNNPTQNIHLSFEGLLQYADSIAANYGQQETISQHIAMSLPEPNISSGKVLGVSINLPSFSGLVNCHDPVAEELNLPYSFSKPKINLTELSRSIGSQKFY